MSQEDLTPDELEALPHRTIIFDCDNDRLLKLSQGWAYLNLLPTSIEQQVDLPSNFFVPGRGPRLYRPYSLQKKADVR